MGCEDCGAPDPRTSLGGAELCDACYNDRTAAITGWPRLPAAPPPIVITGPDERAHELRFRVLRVPTGIEVMLEEAGVGAGEGYRFAVLGDHDAAVGPLVAHVRAIAEREVAHQYLEPAEGGAGWSVTDGAEVAGRLVSSADGPSWRPFDVVIDGRTLTWEQFGEALSSYEGWNFRLVIEDRVVEARTAGEVIDIRRPRSRPSPPNHPAP